MKKKGLIFAVALAVLPVVVQPSVALAEEKVDSTKTSYVEVSVSDLKSMFPINSFENDSSLSQSKEAELSQLAKDANLSNDDIQFLKDQYLKNHSTSQLETSKWKVSVAKKAVKAALPVIKKLAKKAGVKFGQKQLGKIINVLTGVEDNVQGRLEKAFRTMGFSKKQAGIIARAIMFVLF